MKRVFCLSLGLILAGALFTHAELKVGDAAPDFELRGTDGASHKLSDLKGEAVVIAWFPKAFTKG